MSPLHDVIRFAQICASSASILSLLSHSPLQKQYCFLSLSCTPPGWFPFSLLKKVKQFNKTRQSRVMQKYANRFEMPGFPWAFSLQFYPGSESPAETTSLGSRRARNY